MKFEKLERYVQDENKELICFDLSEKFAYLCPFSYIEDGQFLKLNTKEVYVYSRDESVDNNTSIEEIEVYQNKDKK